MRITNNLIPTKLFEDIPTPNPQSFPLSTPYKLSCSDLSRLEAASALLHACFIIFIKISDRVRKLANVVGVGSDRNLVVV